MRKKLGLLVVSIFILLNAPIVYGDVDKTIRIAGDVNYPPYEYLDENNNYKGFNVDTMRAIAIELGLDIELIPMTWDQALVALGKGEVDAIQGMTKSNIRERTFSFSTPLITNSQAIFVKKDNTYISSVNDLSGIKVAFQKGDISYEVINSNVKIIPIVKNDQLEAMESLLSGEVEAFIGNRLTGLYYLQKYKRLNEIKIVGDPMYVTEYSSATIKGNDEILDILNSGIAEIKKNGTYDKIYKKWFGETFERDNNYWKRLVYFTLLGLFIVLIILTGIIYWNRLLKVEVSKRTKELAFQKKILDRSNRLRGRILESIASGIVAFNQEGEVLISNSYARNLLEIDLNPGTQWKYLGLEEKLDSPSIKKALVGETWKKSIEIERSDGERYYIYCSIVPIKGPDEIEGAIVHLHDYTKEKQLQKMVTHNDKMQALGKISAGIAHELRNPLTSIKTFIDIMPEKLHEEKFRHKLMKIVPEEIQRLDSLVKMLLDYAKPKSSNPEEIKLDKIIDDILTLFSFQIRKENIKVINNSSSVGLWADKSQIKQVLINIILNAIDALNEGGIITIESYHDDGNAKIIITDNGHGIPEDVISKVFDPFFTLKKKGYGIGLAICHQLIKENGGDIDILSTIGKGTKVVITVPAASKREE